MLKTKLSPCANLLYHWILWRQNNDGQLTIDLQDFKAWTGEYREHPYSDREIFDALQQLKETQSITIGKTEVTVAIEGSNLSSFADRSPLELLLKDCKHYRVKPASAKPFPSSDRLHPIVLISLVAFTSFVVGLIPVAIAFSRIPAGDRVLATLTPWSVVGEKN